jgi:hypothetical protein
MSNDKVVKFQAKIKSAFMYFLTGYQENIIKTLLFFQNKKMSLPLRKKQ